MSMLVPWPVAAIAEIILMLGLMHRPKNRADSDALDTAAATM